MKNDYRLLIIFFTVKNISKCIVLSKFIQWVLFNKIILHYNAQTIEIVLKIFQTKNSYTDISSSIEILNIFSFPSVMKLGQSEPRI